MIRIICRLSAGSFWIIDLQRERECSICRSIFAGDDLRQVQVGTTVVNSSQTGCACIRIVLFTVDGIRCCAGRSRMLIVDQDQHRSGAVDEHRAYDRRFKFPVILLITEFSKLEVVALRTRECLSVLDDTDGNERLC